MVKSAVKFLQDHGANALVSLGCGDIINRIDNHLRLMLGCGLQYYVGIDRTPEIQFEPGAAFSDQLAAGELIGVHSKTLQGFRRSVNLFPETHVEDLHGIECGVVVCQRVLPFRRWESIIESMRPKLILQEDLHGCELQEIGAEHYVRSRAGVRHYRLTPFRPWRVFPGERNLILWRRRDFFTCQEDLDPWWKRIHRQFARGNGTRPAPADLTR